MNRYEKSTFTNAQVQLDGNEYIGCTFNSCIFVYQGRDTFSLIDNHISMDCKLAVSGAAANTVGAMKAIYSMGDWGRRQILGTFEQIAPDFKKRH